MPIILTKDSPPVLLSKEAGGLLKVRLDWSTPLDLDLACMYELTDGTKEVVQALENIDGVATFGNLNQPPYIKLRNDDRSGGSEELKVNLGKASEIKRLLVFAYVYSGGTWVDAGVAKVTVTHPTQGEYEIQLAPTAHRSCTLVGMHTDPADGEFKLTREEIYFVGTHEEIDHAYGWPNIAWSRGSKH